MRDFKKQNQTEFGSGSTPGRTIGKRPVITPAGKLGGKRPVITAKDDRSAAIKRRLSQR